MIGRILVICRLTTYRLIANDECISIARAISLMIYDITYRRSAFYFESESQNVNPVIKSFSIYMYTFATSDYNVKKEKMDMNNFCKLN